MNEKRRCAFAVCGSFCTLETALEQAQELTARGWELLPVMSNTAARCDTRFGRAGSWRQLLDALSQRLSALCIRIDTTGQLSSSDCTQILDAAKQFVAQQAKSDGEH